MRSTRTVCFAALLVALPLIVACGGDDDDDDDDVVMTDADPNQPDAPVNVADAAPDPDAPIADFCTPQSGTNLQLVEIASGLDNPLFVTAPSGDPRLFIVERDGRIKVWKNGSVLPTLFLDITGPVRTGLSDQTEQGLLGLAFHPNYSSNGRFFVNYTADSPGGATVIAEYAVSSDPDVADTNETRLLTISQPFANHNGGWIDFGPDGYLYIASGDGGSSNDPGNRGQRTDTLLGKMLRIDVDTGDPYGIPADNPFVGVTGEDEIWSYGLRNPWRSSFDRTTGDLYIGDVGQVTREEINFQPASSTGGENYGWKITEGLGCRGGGVVGTDCTAPAGYVPPIIDHDRGGGRCSITGGYVYRGECLTDWQGVYFYGDYCSGQVFTLVENGGAATMTDDISSNLDPSGVLQFELGSFGEDAFGELYVVALFGGTVYRIEIE